MKKTIEELRAALGRAAAAAEQAEGAKDELCIALRDARASHYAASVDYHNAIDEERLVKAVQNRLAERGSGK